MATAGTSSTFQETVAPGQHGRRIVVNPAWVTSPWLDKGMYLILLLGPFMTSVVNRLVDGSQAIYDASGNQTIINPGGTASRLVYFCFAGMLLAAAAALVFRALMTGRGRVTPIAAMGFLTIIATVTRDGSHDIVDFIPGGIAAMVAGLVYLSVDVMEVIGKFATGASVFQLLYSFSDLHGSAWVPCRSDKCTPAGGLMEGIFWAENSLAVFCLLLLPPIAFVRSGRWRFVGLTTTLTCLYFTGSRVGYLAGALALVGYFMVRRIIVVPDGEHEWQRPQGPFRVLRPLARALSLAPLIGYLGSIVLTFTLSPTGLTDRGDVYRIVRAANADPAQWMLGAGLPAIQAYFQRGHALFLMATEHGEFPYLLNETGALSAACFLLACIVLVRRSATYVGAMAASSLLGPSVFLMTESTMGLSYKAPVFAIATLGTICGVDPAPPFHRIRRGEPGWTPLVIFPSIDRYLTAARQYRRVFYVIPVLGAVVGGVWAAQQPTVTAQAPVILSVQKSALHDMMSDGKDYTDFVSSDVLSVVTGMSDRGLEQRIVPGTAEVTASVNATSPGVIQLKTTGTDAVKVRHTLDVFKAALVAKKSMWSSSPTTATPLDTVVTRSYLSWLGIPVGALLGLLAAAVVVFGDEWLRGAPIGNGETFFERVERHRAQSRFGPMPHE